MDIADLSHIHYAGYRGYNGYNGLEWNMVNDGLIMDRYGYAYTILHDMMDNNMVKNGLILGQQWVNNGFAMDYITIA